MPSREPAPGDVDDKSDSYAQAALAHDRVGLATDLGAADRPIDVAVCGGRHTVRVWDAGTGQPVGEPLTGSRRPGGGGGAGSGGWRGSITAIRLDKSPQRTSTGCPCAGEGNLLARGSPRGSRGG